MNTTPKIILSNVKDLNEALEINQEANDGAKFFGITTGAKWNYDDSCHVAECIIGDGATSATILLERKMDDWENAPDRGVDFEAACHELGEELGEWLQKQFGPEFEYASEISKF